MAGVTAVATGAVVAQGSETVVVVGALVGHGMAYLSPGWFTT